jgi:hypothetical protein
LPDAERHRRESSRSTISIVHSERPVIGKMQYDLGVYQEGKQFNAIWFCVECPARGKTERVAAKAQRMRKGWQHWRIMSKSRHGG